VCQGISCVWTSKPPLETPAERQTICVPL